MLQIETKLDLIDLLAKAEKLPYKRDDSGALMAYPQSVRIPPDSPFQSAIKEIALIRGLEPLFLTINILPPGVIVPIHTDTLIGKVEAERWHLPLLTNPGCTFWDEESGDHHFEYGFWSGPVRHWINHSVKNTGVMKRIHLVVDLKPE